MNSLRLTFLPGGAVTACGLLVVFMLGAFLAVNHISQAQGGCGFEGQYDWYGDQYGGGICEGGGEQNNPRVLTLTANPSSITQGASSLLSWGWNYQLTDGPQWVCSINNGVGTVPLSSTRLVYPSSTTNYEINCTVSGEIYWGEDSQGNPVFVPVSNSYSSTAEVAVTPSPSPTATLTASPSSIQTGGTSTLAWSSTNATSCTGTGFSTGGASSGSLSVMPVSSTNYSVSCTGPGGTAGAYATVTVTAPVSAADLTAGDVSPSSASLNQTVTVTAPVSNIGGLPAGASNGYFTLTAPVSKQSTTATVAVPALAAGASHVPGFSYTFRSTGTYTVRLCADWNGAVAESNEGNNCGPTGYISVADVPVPSSVSCNVSTQSAVVGQSVTYSASGVGAATSPYGWTGSDGATGFGSGSTAVRTFSATGTYGMQVTATNAVNTAQCPLVTVGGNWCTTGSPTLTITATPNRVRAGQSSSIAWSASNVNGEGASCTVTGLSTPWTSTVSAAPVCSAGSSATETINTQRTFTLTCGGQSQSVTVNVIPGIIEF